MILKKSLSFETGPASPRTTAIGMGFAASVILIATIYVARITYDLDITGQRAQGEVVEYAKTGQDMQSAVFQFVDSQGRIHRVYDSTQSSYKKYEIGEKVLLVYKQDDPSGARKDSGAWLYIGPFLLGFMSVLFYAGAALVWRFQAHFQKDYEARRGRMIVTVVNNDGSFTQTTHSSVPVFRWTGIFLAGLGIVSMLGALWFTLYDHGPTGRSLNISVLVYLAVVGSLLLLGAAASLRHAKFLQNLEESSDNLDSA